MTLGHSNSRSYAERGDAADGATAASRGVSLGIGERPLRVAMIIQAYHPRVGGAERQLAAVAKRLQAAGVEVHVVTRRHPGMTPRETVDGVDVHRIPVPGPKALASLAFTAAALPVLARLQPDVVHAHELLSPTTTALAYKALFRVPVIAKVLRGGELGDVAKLNRGRSGRLRIGAMRAWVDRFVVISREIETELDGLRVCEGRRIFVPNGVDVERYRPLDPQDKRRLRRSLGLGEAPVAIFAGRLEPEKRVDLLLDLWPRVRAAVPGATLLVAGTGGREAALRRMAGEGVRFLGVVDDMAPWYQAADVFVLPSSTEGLSNALLEAMACGLRCVATAVGGAPEVIEHGRNGYLVAPDAPAPLLEQLTRALSGRDDGIGEAARARIVSDYSLDATAAGLLNLYRHLAPAR